ncbi:MULTISPECIES: hypothetical protein [unclassified Haloparvum]|uniref:hypothetical protein n=1 Tax=Haloparvum sp. PAK95 TaxID=3418962 RepID=UPI003D2EED04
MDPLFVDLATVRSVLYYGAVYAIVVGMAAWIYQDAKSRGSRAPLAWALATLALTIIPVVSYLYLRWRATPAAGDAVGKPE